MALELMPTSHAAWGSHYQKSLLRDNDRAVFRAKLVIIYVDWIVLLRRLLMVTKNVASPAQNEPVIGLEDRLLLTHC